MQCVQKKPCSRDREVSGNTGSSGVQVGLQRELSAQDPEGRQEEPDASVRGMHGEITGRQSAEPAGRAVKNPFAATVWTDEMISTLTKMRNLGCSYTECAKVFGLCRQTVAKKARQLGLPNYAPEGWHAHHKKAPQHQSGSRSKVASIISGLDVGEYHDFPRPNPAEGKRIHKLVSKYGGLSGKGFRGRVDIIRGILRVTRIR